MKFENSIQLLVENGYTVEKKRKHFYKVTKDKYRILKFDANHNLRHTAEENFNELTKAIERFIQLTNDV